LIRGERAGGSEARRSSPAAPGGGHEHHKTFTRSGETQHADDGVSEFAELEDCRAEEGVQALVDLYQVFCAGLNSPGRRVGNLLFLGPTGSGKTRIVEAAAEILFGDPRAVIKVDCAEFQHSHEIAKLIGSPPGYLGHRETHPLYHAGSFGGESYGQAEAKLFCFLMRLRKPLMHFGSCCWGCWIKRL